MVFSRVVPRWLPFLLLPFLAACSDQRASFEIKGSAHALTLIRVTGMPWAKTAKYDIVAARMPDCMRRHEMGPGGADSKVEVYAPGNDAWLDAAARRYPLHVATAKARRRAQRIGVVDQALAHDGDGFKSAMRMLAHAARKPARSTSKRDSLILRPVNAL